MGTADIASIKLTCFKKDVYEPCDDSFLLVDTVRQLYESTWKRCPPRVCVEVGCGSGYITCSLALLLDRPGFFTQLYATDVNPSAAAAAVATLTAHGQPHAADIIVCDLTRALQPRLNGLVDLLVFNPPYVPTPDEEVSKGGIAAAWAGGNRGRLVIDRFLPLVPSLLSPEGEFLLVVVHENDPGEIMEVMAGLGLEGSVAGRRIADEEVLSVLRFRFKRRSHASS